MAKLTIRRAELSDVPLLQDWDQRAHVIAATTDNPDCPEDWDWPNELAPRDDGVEFYIAALDNKPIGMLCIIDPQTERSHYWSQIGPNLRALDIWIGEEAYLGQGWGSAMMEWALRECFATPSVEAVLIDPLASNTRAHRFYERFGFVFVEQRQFDENSNCFVYRLTRETFFGT